MSFEARDNVVTKFHNAGAPRVLIFSSVGSAGLNLSIANTIIFMVCGLKTQEPCINHNVGSALERTR